MLNVGEPFPDGSLRLVRDLPVGTPQWKRLYHQARNAVEGRNATRERWGLKRLPVYGDPRGRAIIFQSDVWGNLTTLAAWCVKQPPRPGLDPSALHRPINHTSHPANVRGALPPASLRRP